MKRLLPLLMLASVLLIPDRSLADQDWTIGFGTTGNLYNWPEEFPDLKSGVGLDFKVGRRVIRRLSVFGEFGHEWLKAPGPTDSYRRYVFEIKVRYGIRNDQTLGVFAEAGGGTETTKNFNGTGGSFGRAATGSLSVGCLRQLSPQLNFTMQANSRAISTSHGPVYSIGIGLGVEYSF